MNQIESSYKEYDKVFGNTMNREGGSDTMDHLSNLLFLRNPVEHNYGKGSCNDKRKKCLGNRTSEAL